MSKWWEQYDNPKPKRKAPKPSAGAVRALGIGVVGIAATCYFLTFGIPAFLTAPLKAAAAVELDVKVHIESKPIEKPEPKPVSKFWDVVIEGRKKESESEYRHETWLEGNEGRLVSMTGSVLEVSRRCCGDEDTCRIFMKMPAQPTMIRQFINMPCDVAGTLVKKQEFTAICAMNGEWEEREEVPEFHECTLSPQKETKGGKG